MFSSLTLDQDIVGGKGDNDSSTMNNVYIEDVIDGVTDIKWMVWMETTENHNENWADDVDVGPGRIISIMASVDDNGACSGDNYDSGVFFSSFR